MIAIREEVESEFVNPQAYALSLGVIERKEKLELRQSVTPQGRLKNHVPGRLTQVLSMRERNQQGKL